MNKAGNGPEEVRRSLVERSIEDERLRQRLLEDPKTVIEQEMGARLPEEVEIRVVEETPETIYLVLPPRSPGEAGGGELSDRELDALAGGRRSTMSQEACYTSGRCNIEVE